MGPCPGFTPALECLQVQYLVQYIVGLVGTLVEYIGDAIFLFGGDIVESAGNAMQMNALTTGIFGTDSGLIYWINDKVFYIITYLPWCDLGTGLGQLMQGFQGATCT